MSSWLAARVFCLQQGGRLPNWTEIQAIEDDDPSILPDGKQYWMDYSEAKAYHPDDPLHGWYWSNGSSLNVNQRWGLDGKVQDIAGKEKCAFVRNQKGGLFWHDTWCSARRSFICKRIDFCNFTVSFRLLS